MNSAVQETRSSNPFKTPQIFLVILVLSFYWIPSNKKIKLTWWYIQFYFLRQLTQIPFEDLRIFLQDLLMS